MLEPGESVVPLGGAPERREQSVPSPLGQCVPVGIPGLEAAVSLPLGSGDGRCAREGCVGAAGGAVTPGEPGKPGRERSR